FSLDGTTWGGWLHYPRVTVSDYFLSLRPGDGIKILYARFRDSAGHISPIASDTIYLDTAPTTDTVSIDGGAVYTNSENVILTLGAPGPGYREMLISNDGGFSGAIW